jgi:hypothetical protein
MKSLLYLTLVFMIVFCAGTILGQTTIVSKGNGAWHDTTTWQGSIIPTGLDSIVIRGTDSVWFHPSPALADSCRSLTILSGGKFSTPSSADTLKISNRLTLQANAWYYDSSYTGKLPGKYYSIDHASTVVFGTSSIGGRDTSGLGSDCLEFGNVIMKRNAGATAGGNLLIHGDLTINNNQYNQVFKGIDSVANATTGGHRVHHVEGNVYIYKGILSCIDKSEDTTTCTWNIDGNVTIAPQLVDDARIGPFSSAYARGLGIFNIKGNLLINKGRLQISSSSSHSFGTGIFNLGGNFTMTGGAHVTSNTSGPCAINFVGSGMQTVSLDTNFSLRAQLFDTVATGSHVIFDLGSHVWYCLDTLNAPGGGGGAFVVNGTLELKDSSQIRGTASFELNAGATLKVGQNDGIVALPDSTNGNIQLTGGRTFSTDANYEYFGGVYQVTGDGLPSSVHNLTINNSNDVKMTAPVTVNGTLAVLNGDLKTDTNYVTIGNTGNLSETAGNTVRGKVIAVRTVGASTTEDFGGIGAKITSDVQSLGLTTVTRVTNDSPSGSGHSAIARYFDIDPTNNSGLNATLEFIYDGSELNGQDSSQMLLWYSQDIGSTWYLTSSVNNATQYKMTANGLNHFSRWTGSDVNHMLSHPTFISANWNMISLAYSVPNNAKAALFPTSQSRVFTFDKGYVAYDTLQNMIGYWLKFGAVETVYIHGSDRLADSVSVKRGWNMIGSISKPVGVGTIGESTTGMVTSAYYGYSDGYAATDFIYPGKAYWVKSSTDGTLYLNAATVAAKHGTSPESQLEQLNTITLSNSNGQHQVLYFGKDANGQIDASFFELPPAGPQGSFDARFASNRCVQIVPSVLDNAATYSINVSSSDSPITIAWKMKNDENTSYTLVDDKGNKQTLAGTGKSVISQPTKTLSLIASGNAAVPVEFSLSKNYPNPFNPTTNMVIGLPVAGHVDVEVFDILGQKIKTILSEDRAAGFHTIEWNGLTEKYIQASTGMYFVKMTSGKFNAVQKIMLMK